MRDGERRCITHGATFGRVSGLIGKGQAALGQAWRSMGMAFGPTPWSFKMVRAPAAATCSSVVISAASSANGRL